MSEILHNSKKINTNSGAWNIAVLISIVFLIYLPSKEALSTSEQSGGYLELLSLLPAGIFYTLLVTFLGSAAFPLGDIYQSATFNAFSLFGVFSLTHNGAASKIIFLPATEL